VYAGMTTGFLAPGAVGFFATRGGGPVYRTFSTTATSASDWKRVCSSILRASSCSVKPSAWPTLARSSSAAGGSGRRDCAGADAAKNNTPTRTGSGRNMGTLLYGGSSAANETCALVANRGVALAGNVASVASPTRNTSKSFDRFSYPAVVLQKHMSVAYPVKSTCRTPCRLRKSRSGG